MIETAVGCDRAVLTVFCDAYRFNEDRVVMKFHPKFAPVKAAVLPLMKKDELMVPAHKLYDDLRKHYKMDFDASGSIGKRYRRNEEIGTPFCITLDYESLADHSVTIRHRDTMAQERILMTKVREYIDNAFANWNND